MEVESILDKFRESFNRFKEDAFKREDALKKDLTNIKQVHSKLFQELEDSKKCQDLYKVEIIQLKSSLQKSSLLFREKVSVKDQVNHQLEQDNAHLVEQRKLDSQKIEQLVNTLYKMKRGFEDQFSKHKEEVSNNFCSYESKIKILMLELEIWTPVLTVERYEAKGLQSPTNLSYSAPYYHTMVPWSNSMVQPRLSLWTNQRSLGNEAAPRADASAHLHLRPASSRIEILPCICFHERICTFTMATQFGSSYGGHTPS